MALNPVQIGPFPQGVDTYHEPTHQVFQPGRRGQFPRLRSAINVDLDEAGNVERRDGVTERVVSVAGKTVFSGAGLLLFQDEGNIKSVNTSTWVASNVVTGLSDSVTVQFHDLAGKVFYTNGTVNGIITAAGAGTNWGMTVPPQATLNTTVGGLPEGRYRVACTLLDANGVMSGAPKAKVIDVDGAEDITVTISPIDSNATHVRIYASYANTPDMWMCKQVAVGALPATLSAVLTGSENSSEPLRTQFLQGPISGFEGLASWGGMILSWKGKYVVRSQGNRHHLFDLRRGVWKQPYDVQAVSGIEDGPCYVALTKGMIRYSGQPGRENFQRKQLDGRKYAAGAKTVWGDELNGLDGVAGRVALFASENGLAIGLPNGNVVHPMKDLVSWDVSGMTATFAFRKKGNLNQIVVTLGDGSSTTTYAINADTFAQVTYSGEFDNVHALAEHEGELYAISDTSLFQQTGSDDDGTNIDASITTGQIDFGDQERVKYVPRAYLFLESDGKTKVTTTTKTRRVSADREYPVRAAGSSTYNVPKMVELAQGVESIDWGFKLENTSGASMKVQSMKVLVRTSRVVR